MAEVKAREIIESGFKVTVPEEASFRFEENQHYRKLSGIGLKEMDVGWWNNDNNKLIFLELKGIEVWEGFDKSKDNAYEYLVKSLKGKVTDVLLIMAATWIETGIGKDIKTQLPKVVHQYPGDGSLKLIILIDTPDSRKPLLSPLKDAVNNKLAGRVRLFGVPHVTIIDFDTANKMGLPVTRDE